MEIERFFDRKVTLELLKKRVLDLKDGYRQNVAFLGSRHIGKTSLLQKFMSDLDDPRILPVYIDCAQVDLNDFVSKLVGGLLYNYSKIKSLPLPEDIPLLLESASRDLPQTVKAGKKIFVSLAHDKTLDAFREAIALPQIFTKESGVSCVLLLDEFHLLEDLGVPDVFQELGKKIMTQRHCLYIVTSSLPRLARKILSERLSLLFGHFEIVEIDVFAPRAGQAFVRSQLKDVAISDMFCRFLVDLTGGHPLYLRLLSQELVSLSEVHQQKEIFLPLLQQSVENVLFQPWGILNRHFDRMLERVCRGRSPTGVSAILAALTHGRQTSHELAKAAGLKSNFVNQKLSRLLEMELVGKNGNYYYPRDKLLRFWIKYIFQKRGSFDLDVERQRNVFREGLLQLFENFKIDSGKALSSRIIELLTCFENEAFLINGRRYKLPLLKEIRPKRIQKISGEYFDVITATAPDGDWWIVLNAGTIGENDIHAILTESRNISGRPQRCVLISLADLDENARVKALQERMWIWNEGELNTLLNLYDQPYIA